MKKQRKIALKRRKRAKRQGLKKIKQHLVKPPKIVKETYKPKQFKMKKTKRIGK